MYTTLNRIQEHDPCTDGWKKLLNHLGKTSPDDEPLSLLAILDSNGLDYALWCFRAVDGFAKEKQLLAITYAKEVEHLMPVESKKAFDVFERYANGSATEKEFEKAATWAADAAAYATAWAARDVAWAARAAAAARAADVRAALAAYATAAPARDVAWAAAARAADVRAARAADAACAAAAADAADAADAAAHAAQISDATASDIYSTIRTKQEAQLRQLLEETK